MTNLEIYNSVNKQVKALSFALYLVGWDNSTEAPKGCFETRGRYVTQLNEMVYKLVTSPEYVNAVKELDRQGSQLDPVLRREVHKMAIEIDDMAKIPVDEYNAFNALRVEMEQVYFEAKAKSDFELFKPYLKKVIEYMKKLVVWQEKEDKKGYDVLLDRFEEGFNSQRYDKFFDALRERLVPFVKKICALPAPTDMSFAQQNFDCDAQREFARYLQQVMNFDMNRGVMKESEHPFTTSADINDVRVTVHYYEDNVFSAIFSAIHEMGHGLYEQQLDPALIDTMSCDMSMGMHESQSRFYENIIGRSEIFWQTHFEQFKKTFPSQLKDVSAQDIYKAVNYARTSLIRTEADELTYPIHIMIRYELERKMMEGQVDEENVKEQWNRLYKDYLGVTVPDDKSGVLQDVHWSFGTFGYFPTYALGSAYAAQLYNTMRKEIDVDKIIASGCLKGINDWLKEKVHRFGSSKSPEEIIFNATGEDLNPDYYIDYLIEKYSKVYGIK